VKFRVTFDRSANAAYIYFDGEIERGASVAQCPVECPKLKGELILDIDKHGRLLGMEVLGATRVLPYRFTEEAERL
jgi:uncharacterized protein YuzE